MYITNINYYDFEFYYYLNEDLRKKNYNIP